jgi:hypothetical protein
MRKIVVAREGYLWSFTPRYERDANDQWVCHDLFTAYQEHNKRAPLRVHFVTWKSPVEGGPLRTGVPIDPNDPSSGGINLHQPRFADAIIRAALGQGWDPSSNQPLDIENGMGLLRELDAT